MATSEAAFYRSRYILLAGGVLLLFLGLFVLLYGSQYVRVLAVGYPIVAVIIGGALYAAHPPLFLGFMWWIWFITPFVRRIIDFQQGYYTDVSPIMLTPFLVSAFSVFTVLRWGKWLKRQVFFPFSLAMMGVLYGFMVGIVRSGLLSATYDLLSWLLPIILGFHVFVHWDQYPQNRKVLRSTFTWGVLIMGTYGILQFISPPGWDTMWLVESGMTSSAGRPEAFAIRTFSTLNSPGPFAMVMMTGLLILFDGKKTVHRIATVPGYISFMLSLVRAAWGAWFVGLVFMILRFSSRMRMRLIYLLAIGIVLSIPLLLYRPIQGRVESRVETMSSLDDDNSFRARSRLYTGGLEKALLNPIGAGIGSTGTAAKLSVGQTITFDSGVLAIPYTLGWPGTLLYVAGIFLILKSVLRIREPATDQFAVITGAIVLAFVAGLLFVNQLTGLPGFVSWTFIGMTLAAQAYYGAEKQGI